MVPSVRSALTTCIALMVVGGEARKTRGIGPTPAAPNRHRAAMFSFAAMAVFLVLSACAEAPATEPRASSPAQRNVTAPAPDPCAIPSLAQPYGRDIVSVASPQLRPSNMRCPDYSRGFPSVLGGWTEPAPRRLQPEAQSPDEVRNANARRNDVLNERMWLRAHGRRDTNIRF
jgi:hypothetical protein